MSTLLNLSLYY